MSVAVATRCRRRGVRLASIRADAARLLSEMNVDAELSVVLVDDAEMQALNARYRNQNQPTDVLAFSMREGGGGLRPQARVESSKSKASARNLPARVRKDLLGDVVISVDTAARQATERGVSVSTEVRTLLTHGILHLLGYDHERSRAHARRMFALQRRLVRLLDRQDRR